MSSSSSDAIRLHPAPPPRDDAELGHSSPGVRPSKIATLLEAHAAAGLEIVTDILTRTTGPSDYAPDVSMFPNARDRAAGRPQLGFEVVSTESLARAGRKAAKLLARGVRRVIAIDVERARALEWSRPLATWSVLDTAAELTDPTLAVALPIEALVRAAKADDLISRARRTAGAPAAPASELSPSDGVPQSRGEGRQQGRAEVVLTILIARGVAVSEADRARILGERDPERLRRWLARAAVCTAIGELFADA